MLEVLLLVKKVPTLRPCMMALMAFSCMPLQMTTHTPRSSAQVAACTCEQYVCVILTDPY